MGELCVLVVWWMEGFGLMAFGDTHLLHAVADGLELIGEVLATGLHNVRVGVRMR